MSTVNILDLEPATETFLDDVMHGLRSSPRHLPCKYFYDERGSKIFDRICDLEEYYLTRTELSIMQECSSEMAEQIGQGVMLVEYGSGSSIKTRLLLDHLVDPVAYVPVDISREHLQKTADRLSMAYPDIEVLPVCADFTESFHLPTPQRDPSHAAVYFPGSTIGNFPPDAICKMLSGIATLCQSGGGMLIGIDLQKDVSVIEAAYNDASGVTADFNLNLLQRINRELNADFEIEQYEHHAFYDDRRGRVEMQLISQCDQTVSINGEEFELESGEPIRTEFSHKFTIEGFAQVAAQAGLTLRKSWTDDEQMFALLHFVVS